MGFLVLWIGIILIPTGIGILRLSTPIYVKSDLKKKDTMFPWQTYLKMKISYDINFKSWTNKMLFVSLQTQGIEIDNRQTSIKFSIFFYESDFSWLGT